MGDEYVTVCPKCGSTDIKAETNPAYVVTGLLWNFKQCMNCKYHGQFFPEELKEDVRKSPLEPSKVQKRNLVDTSFGKAYFKYLVYIAIPVLIITFILTYLGLL